MMNGKKQSPSYPSPASLFPSPEVIFTYSSAQKMYEMINIANPPLVHVSHLPCLLLLKQ